MYVCLCKGITENHIRQAVAEGHDSLRALNSQLGVGSQCARCVRHAREVIREARDECETAQGNPVVLVQYWSAIA